MRSSEFSGRSRLILLPAVLLALLVVPVITAKSTQAREEPEGQRLIAEAEGIAHGFSPEERADLLLDMLETPMGDFPVQGKSWSLELFSISKNQLRPGAYRAAIQKNALIHLAKVDPLEAAKLFKTQDTPDMWDQPVLMEDYRTWWRARCFLNSGPSPPCHHCLKLRSLPIGLVRQENTPMLP